jgi:aspartyl/asparaginyl beta-hydroxylase (cupin superfamily)
MSLENERRDASTGLLELGESALADLVTRFPSSDLTRVRGFIDNITGRTIPIFHPHQSTAAPPIHFPGLPNEPFLDTALFPEARELMAAYLVIKRETARVLDGSLPLKHFGSTWRPRPHNEAADEMAWKKWKRFMFYSGDPTRRLDDNCRMCPETSALIDRVAGAADDFLTAGILVQEGRMTLKPHVDDFNLFVTLMLPIVVPGPCGVAVGGERRLLEAGTCVAFDNSFFHYTWNDTDQARIVLVLYRLTPHITAAESAAWAYLKKTYGPLLARVARTTGN